MKISDYARNAAKEILDCLYSKIEIPEHYIFSYAVIIQKAIYEATEAKDEEIDRLREAAKPPKLIAKACKELRELEGFPLTKHYINGLEEENRQLKQTIQLCSDSCGHVLKVIAEKEPK